MSTLERAFHGAAALSVRRPVRVLAVTAVLVALALGAAAVGLDLRTSNLDLVDPDLPPVRRFLDFATEFGSPNVLVVVLEGESTANGREALRTAATHLAPRLRELSGVRTVLDRKPLDAAGLEILGVDPWFTSRDGGLLFLFVQPDDPSSSAATLGPFVDGVRRALAEADLGAAVHAGLTGMPAYAIDDRDVIQRDVSRLSALSLVVILGLFVAGFGALRRPLAAVLALLAAVAVTAGLIALHPGHLTLLSAFFAAILLGLGIDAGIHLIDRVEERMAGGESEALAIPAAAADLARALTTGALTTASVLFSLRWSGFRGFAELGTIAAAGILVCLAATVTVLPALLALFQGLPARVTRRVARRRTGSRLAVFQSPLLAVLLAAAALGGAAFQPAFDTDYLNLEPRGSEAVRLEREMVRRSDYSPEFAVVTADTLEEVRDLTWRLADDETVASVRSLTALGALALDDEAAVAAGLRSPAGRYALYVHPAEDVWQSEHQAAFLAHLRSVDPEVTGMPVLGSFMVERSRQALRRSAVVGSLLLVAWVLWDFRRPLPALLALLPTLLTAACLGAWMRLFGVAWNPLDVMALPVILGIAVDDGVHLVHRFLREGGSVERTLAGTGRAVVLTSATTLAAFGALAFTAHRGLASFALVLVFGVSTALVTSVAVLPQALRAFRGPLLRGPFRKSR